MTRIKDIVASFIGEAAAFPEFAPQIYERASQTFAGYAVDPNNAGVAQLLHALAADFGAKAQRPASISDFRELLRNTAQAYNEVGDYVDDLDPVARRDEIFEARSPGLANVSIAPKSIGQTKTRLGNIVKVKWNPAQEDILNGIKQVQGLVYWQGEKQEAQSVTVAVGLVQPQREAASRPRPYGEVSFGSDGALIRAKFDIGYGTRFTLPASYVDVSVSMRDPGPDYPGSVLQISGSLGFFAAPSAAPVLYTEYIDTLSNVPGANESAIIQRPSMATALLPMQSSLVGGTATIRFLGLDGLPGFPIYIVNWTNSAQNIAIPLTNDISFIQVVNTGAAASNFRLPFQLAL